MGSKASDFKLYIPFSADLKSCLVETDCTDLIAAPENFNAPTKNYCGVGSRRRLHSVSEENPPDNTLTLQTTDPVDLQVLRELAIGECPFIIQKRHCEGAVETFRFVTVSTRTPQGRLTASGLNATDDPILTNYDASYENMVYVGPPADSVPSLFINNQGRNESSPNGEVNGVNTVFTLNPAPSPGFPIVIILNLIVLTIGIDYNISGNTITFVVAPECGDDLTVIWYDIRYQVFGKQPIACWFCDQPNCITGVCGGRRSNGCENVHAIYISDEAPPEDICGDVGENFTLFATYRLSPSGAFTLTAVETLNFSNAVDALCTVENEIYIATETQIYQGCGTGFVAMDVNLPSGTVITQLAYSEETGEIYALFGTSGVLKLSGDSWFVVLADTAFGVGQQNAIAAAGKVVVTGGDNGTLQVSNTGGRTWSTFLCPSAVHTVIDVAVGMRDDLSLVDGTIYILAHDGTNTDLYCTVDYGFTCASRNSWSNQVPVCSWSVEAASDDWLIYVQLDNETWRNINYGCNKCDEWQDVTNPSAPCCSCLTVCQYNPTNTAIIGIGDELTAGDDFYTVPEGGTTTNHLVIANDYGNICIDCGLDLATLAIGTPPVEGAALANGDGTIDYTSPVVAIGTGTTFTYTIDDDCGNQVEATVYITFTA